MASRSTGKEYYSCGRCMWFVVGRMSRFLFECGIISLVTVYDVEITRSQSVKIILSFVSAT